MDAIKAEYEDNGKFQTTKAPQKNIVLIGRCRVGKSAIKSLIIDPTYVCDELSLHAGKRETLFESLYFNDSHTFLNFLDTPGLFERSFSEISTRDNETILQTIEMCINRQLTKLHVICFCISITCGINSEGIESLKLLINFLGQNISENSCLIITRCESICEEQREKLRCELMEDTYFREIASFFKLGIYFSGSLNSYDFAMGNDSLYEQFLTISDYRTKLIELFTSDIEPIRINEFLTSEILLLRQEERRRARTTEELNSRSQNLLQSSVYQSHVERDRERNPFCITS